MLFNVCFLTIISQMLFYASIVQSKTRVSSTRYNPHYVYSRWFCWLSWIVERVVFFSSYVINHKNTLRLFVNWALYGIVNFLFALCKVRCLPTGAYWIVIAFRVIVIWQFTYMIWNKTLLYLNILDGFVMNCKKYHILWIYVSY